MFVCNKSLSWLINMQLVDLLAVHLKILLCHDHLKCYYSVNKTFRLCLVFVVWVDFNSSSPQRKMWMRMIGRVCTYVAQIPRCTLKFCHPLSKAWPFNRPQSKWFFKNGEKHTRFILSRKVMKSHGINLKVHFPGLEKSRIFRKLAKVMEKSWNFIFRSKHFVLFLKLETILCHRAKILPKRLDFQHFLVMENWNWSWKSHWIWLPKFCVNPAITQVIYSCLVRGEGCALKVPSLFKT